jgi:hypothetical protein
MNKRNWEFYPFQLWVFEDGWRLTFIEVMNFNTAKSRALLTLGWDNEEGGILNIGETP